MTQGAFGALKTLRKSLSGYGSAGMINHGVRLMTVPTVRLEHQNEASRQQ